MGWAPTAPTPPGYFRPLLGRSPWVARSKEANLVIVAVVVWHLLPGEISLVGACNVQKEIMPVVRLRRLIDVSSFHISQIIQEYQDSQALL